VGCQLSRTLGPGEVGDNSHQRKSTDRNLKIERSLITIWPSKPKDVTISAKVLSVWLAFLPETAAAVTEDRQ